MNKFKMGILILVSGIIIAFVGIILIFQSNTKDSNQISSDKASQSIGVVNVNNEADKSAETVAEKESLSSSKEIGNAFEDFVINLLADWRFELLNRAPDNVSSKGVVAKSSENPDLHVGQKRGNSKIEYFLECKYRSKWNNGEVSFEDWQFNRYRQFQKDKRIKVLIALGVGGTPSAPDTL